MSCGPFLICILSILVLSLGINSQIIEVEKKSTKVPEEVRAKTASNGAIFPSKLISSLSPLESSLLENDQIESTSFTSSFVFQTALLTKTVSEFHNQITLSNVYTNTPTYNTLESVIEKDEIQLESLSPNKNSEMVTSIPSLISPSVLQSTYINSEHSSKIIKSITSKPVEISKIPSLTEIPQINIFNNDSSVNLTRETTSRSTGVDLTLTPEKMVTKLEDLNKTLKTSIPKLESQMPPSTQKPLSIDTLELSKIAETPFATERFESTSIMPDDGKLIHEYNDSQPTIEKKFSETTSPDNNQNFTLPVTEFTNSNKTSEHFIDNKEVNTIININKLAVTKSDEEFMLHEPEKTDDETDSATLVLKLEKNISDQNVRKLGKIIDSGKNKLNDQLPEMKVTSVPMTAKNLDLKPEVHEETTAITTTIDIPIVNNSRSNSKSIVNNNASESVTPNDIDNLKLIDSESQTKLETLPLETNVAFDSVSKSIINAEDTSILDENLKNKDSEKKYHAATTDKTIITKPSEVVVNKTSFILNSTFVKDVEKTFQPNRIDIMKDNVKNYLPANDEYLLASTNKHSDINDALFSSEVEIRTLPNFQEDLPFPITMENQEPIHKLSELDLNFTQVSLEASVVNTLVADNKQLTNIASINIRKCCKENEFYSFESFLCETADNLTFIEKVHHLMYHFRPSEINIEAGPIESCPNSNNFPIAINDVANSAFMLLPTGEIYDASADATFNGSLYCLELIGENSNSTLLEMIYCPDPTPEILHYPDYDYEVNMNYIVRKCCESNEYYSILEHKCVNISDLFYFTSEIQQLTFSRQFVDLSIMPENLQQCPNGETPEVFSVTYNMFRLESTGEIIDVSTSIRHNISHYCLEMVGPSEEDLTLTVALCLESYIIPKCCPFGKYFDETQLQCLSYASEDLPKENDLITFFRKDVESYSLTSQPDIVGCDDSFPIEESADNLMLHEGKMCNQMSCFNKSDYCVEFIAKQHNQFTPIVLYCKREIFIKCCEENEILSDRGCISHIGGNSVLLRQLSSTRLFTSSFDNKKCVRGPGIRLGNDYAEYVTWWVSNDGSYLNVRAETENLKIDHYCVDDYIDSNKMISPIAYVCEEEISHLIPSEQNFLVYAERGSLGKCCPQNTKEGYVYHDLSDKNCELIARNETLRENKFLANANFSEEHFHDFHKCSSYHSYPFKPGAYDYVRMNDDRTISMVSKAGQCVTSDIRITYVDMCVDFILHENGQLYPTLFVCVSEPTIKIYTEKSPIIAVLLGISSFCLFLTLITLFTVRVRRGIVTVRKVNTLAGRILMSYVASHFIGFISFTLNLYDNPITAGLSDSVSCYVLAGVTQFFNLATFCWNTSICLESLLLTINLPIAGWVKYLFYSIWAWGFPFFMTLFMFLMDFYETDLPCWVIAPKLAKNTCFFPISDPKPILVYFYIPIFITLIANLSFLIGARMIRHYQLKKLEDGRKNHFSRATPQASAETNQGRSGMRTHRNKNTRVDYIRIVIWTGALWLFDCLAFVLTRFFFSQKANEHWLNYLWYIPSCLNALRGVGVFFIIVLTQEKRKELSIAYGKFKHRVSSKFSQPSTTSKGTRSGTKTSFSVDFSSKKFSFDDERRRNMSVTTVISTLSSSINLGSQDHEDTSNGRKTSISSYISSKIDSIRKKSTAATDGTHHKLSLNNNSRPKRKLGMIRSVSQMNDRKFSIASSTGSFLEQLEMKEDSVRRKYSINPQNVQLPKLQEEETYYEDESHRKFSIDDINSVVDSDVTPSSMEDITNNPDEVDEDIPNLNDMTVESFSESDVSLEYNNDQKGVPDLPQVTCHNECPSTTDPSEVTLTELDIDLEPLEFETPVRFPLRKPSSALAPEDFRTKPNTKTISVVSWTDIDLQLPDEVDFSSVDV